MERGRKGEPYGGTNLSQVAKVNNVSEEAMLIACTTDRMGGKRHDLCGLSPQNSSLIMRKNQTEIPVGGRPANTW